MYISKKAIAALGLVGAMFAGAALAGDQPDFSQAEQQAPFNEMEKNDINRFQCGFGETTAVFYTNHSPVNNLANTITVDFACLARVGDNVMVVSTKRVSHKIGGYGFRQAGPVELGKASYFIFAAN